MTLASTNKTKYVLDIGEDGVFFTVGARVHGRSNKRANTYRCNVAILLMLA